MHANDFVINDGTTGQTIKSVAKLLPHLDRESTAAFIVEPVNAIDAGTLMVAAQQKEVLGILDFVREQEADNF